MKLQPKGLFRASTLLALLVLAGIGAAQNSHAEFNYQHAFDKAAKVATYVDGSIYVATKSYNPTTSNYDMCLVKYLVSNDTLIQMWSTFYDDPNHGLDEVAALVLDQLGNPYLIGTTDGGASGTQMTVAGYTPGGLPLWTDANGDHGIHCPTSAQATDAALIGSPSISSPEYIAVSGFTGSGGEGEGFNGVVWLLGTDGVTKTGWPQTYAPAGNADEVFSAITVDPAGRVYVAGYQTAGADMKNILAVQYAGGGALLRTWSQNVYKDDYATDIAYGAGCVYVSGAFNNGSSYGVSAFSTFTPGPNKLWYRQVSSGIARAIAYNAGHVYATGQLTITPNIAETVNLDARTGDYSADWPSGGGQSTGIRILLDGSYVSDANAIRVVGRNVFISGYGHDWFQGIAQIHYRDFMTTGYGFLGSPIANFPNYWHLGDPNDLNEAFAVDVFRAGKVYSAGQITNEGNGDMNHADAETLYFNLGAHPQSPSGFTVDVGTQLGGTLNSFTSDDGDLLEIQNDPNQPSTAPKVVCTVTGNVGTGVSAISLTVVAHAVANTNQEIQVYNWTSGAYETLDFRASPLVDLPLYLAVPGNPDDYVDGSGNVKMRINYYNAGAVTPNWKGSIDQIGWEYLN